MTELLAAQPARGSTIHLHQPGYHPGRKRRSIADTAALCGVSVYGHHTAPLRDALGWKPTGTDPRPRWVWCRACVGHAVAMAGLQVEVLTWLATRSEDTP